jgi:hypothetical protein
MQQIEEKSGNILALTATVFMLSTAVLGYMMFETYFNKVTVSKAQFICTKIEQVGKHMDEVVCTQYTHQKYSKEAVALNQLVTK